MILAPVEVEKSIRNAVAPNLTRLDGEELSLVGLNLQAVINLKQLPSELVSQLNTTTDRFEYYSQLILIGHGGSLLWQKVKSCQESTIERKSGASAFKSPHPIDDFSRLHVENFFAKRFSSTDFEIIFPTSNQTLVNLQALGKFVGWHNTSPFAVGINQQWGSWFAYRAVVIVKSHYLSCFPTAETDHSESPCLSCQSRDCVQTCPANALSGDKLDLNRCIAYRKQPDSKCKDRCIARMACPVAAQHQYSLEQIQYHYGRSMETINRYQDKNDEKNTK